MGNAAFHKKEVLYQIAKKILVNLDFLGSQIHLNTIALNIHGRSKTELCKSNQSPSSVAERLMRFYKAGNYNTNKNGKLRIRSRNAPLN